MVVVVGVLFTVMIVSAAATVVISPTDSVSSDVAAAVAVLVVTGCVSAMRDFVAPEEELDEHHNKVNKMHYGPWLKTCQEPWEHFVSS